jgi:two-component system response regulator YesN
MAGIELWLQNVCTEIIRVIHRESESRSKMIIQKAKLFIENNYQNQITVKTAADAVMISPSYFLHLFKQVSGETFTDYLTRTRIAKAKALLLGSTFNITEIAYRAGYRDSNYFSTVFKNSEGMTPSAYRKRCNRPH